jgi:hypothetical protein
MKILFVHSNSTPLMRRLHVSRAALYNRLGYDVRLLDSTEYFAPTIFPYLDKYWRKKRPDLIKFYEVLAPELDRCDLFVHYNGANIHPRFLEQFKCIKVYHCADDPEASKVLSQPVAREYDVCAISNIACLDLYRSWGCKHVFFWPLGSSFPDDVIRATSVDNSRRDIPLVFVGSRDGAAAMRYFGRLFGLYKRRRFMETVERTFPEIVAYGAGWRAGFIPDEELPGLYARSRLGLNKHNSSGPINTRLFDLAAFGTMQICDNRKHLGLVLRLDEEVAGYETLAECLELIRHYMNRPDDAQRIAAAARARFERDYSAVPLWEGFVRNLEQCLAAGEPAVGR